MNFPHPPFFSYRLSFCSANPHLFKALGFIKPVSITPFHLLIMLFWTVIWHFSGHRMWGDTCWLASKTYFLTLYRKHVLFPTCHPICRDSWAHGSCPVAIREISQEHTQGIAEENHRKIMGAWMLKYQNLSWYILLCIFLIVIQLS